MSSMIELNIKNFWVKHQEFIGMDEEDSEQFK